LAAKAGALALAVQLLLDSAQTPRWPLWLLADKYLLTRARRLLADFSRSWQQLGRDQ
jgi:hypothetical protein